MSEPDPEARRVASGDDVVTTLTYAAATRPFAALLLGHGAGADQRHPFMVGMARLLAARGLDVVTFNFVYTEKGRRAPDRNDALEACVRAVAADVRARYAASPLFVGGKSMGGRIASQVAARDSEGIAGLVFLGYPLHPPDRPEQLRSAHLPRVGAPMLFVQGERDAFGTPRELAPILGALSAANALTRLHVVAQGDHGLGVPKRAGVPQAEVYADVAGAVAGWMREVTSAS